MCELTEKQLNESLTVKVIPVAKRQVMTPWGVVDADLVPGEL